MACAPRRPSAGEAVEFVDDVLGVGTVGIEDAAAPGEHVVVVFVRRVGDRGEELSVAWRPAHVLGRAAALGGDELRVKGLRIGLADALDPDGMIPAAAKAVEVMNRPGAGILDQVEERCLRCRPWPAAEVGIGNAPARATSPELVEMAIGPAHRRLQHEVQPVEADPQRHVEPAHHRGLDVLERHLETAPGIVIVAAAWILDPALPAPEWRSGPCAWRRQRLSSFTIC